MKTKELRDLTDDDLQQILDDTCRRLFELRVQAQAERLDAPSELLRSRKLIARIKTIQREKELANGTVAEVTTDESVATAVETDGQE
ncbi:MAG: 50S ribosomal protein L29 [Planctomycetaceae bacterium]|nr:50S ribosomal protein L29 [Planctomycetaceae bacterium]MBT5883462.1 50S ribosomal protein L29 [Planctomycetaceae bacterium]